MLNLKQTNIRYTTETMIYKPPVEARVQQLEDENIDTNNMLYELGNDIEMLKIRIQTLENLVIGDNK
jgi:hypothetical protein